MVSSIRHNVTAILCVIVTFLTLTSCSQSIADVCDHEESIKSIGGLLGYQSRGEFCEGLYESKISADFELVSLLYSSFPPFVNDDALKIHVPKLPPGLFPSKARVTALSLKPRMYYRMDAVVGINSSLTWPLNPVVSKIPLTHDDIGIFGWTKRNTDILYTPLNIQFEDEKATSNMSKSVKVAVRAGVNIEYLVWRIVSKDYIGEEFLIEEFHAAGQTIRFKYDAFETSSMTYQLQIDAKPEGSDDWLTQVLVIVAAVE